ncbi:MAG TPA: phosphoglycerate dehydrogenase [Ignavibacteria bacterium]|nr:phosphoglycerate dehydrogenase [Ignavibacteria bacterium]
MQILRHFIFDFDSTFVNTEGFDLLLEISLKNDPEKKLKIKLIREITQKGMNGEISISESLSKRISLLNAGTDEINQTVKILKKSVSASIKRNKKFFKTNSGSVYIISSGFKELIKPVTDEYFISEENIFANNFIFKNNRITGIDKKNLLANNKGKVEVLKKLNLAGDIFVIGDGYTDYELKEAGVAKKFFAFTENIFREKVIKKADHITPSFDEFLYLNKLPMSISYPKNRIKVLLLEKINESAINKFKKEGYQVESVNHSLTEKELIDKINDVSILGIRSKTIVSEKVFANANKLMSIGAFCIGTTQIDLKSAMRKGVVVFNAPFSNTRSVVELALGEMIMLIRKIFDKSNSLHNGIWNKSSVNSYELRGKTLGIVGYGKIGSQLSVLAEVLGMNVLYYDVVEKLSLGNARRCRTLKELYSKSDIISLHIDDNPENLNFISEREFKMMKQGVIFLNLSRGFVIDVKALKKYILNGKISGAAIDVFPYEPVSNDEKFISELQGLPNVILTPHIGGSTEEAQIDIANFVPSKIINFVNKGDTSFSVNFPNLQLPELRGSHRLIHIHENIPGILAKINNILAVRKINIIGQYLKTNEDIGFVITDIAKKYNPEVLNELKRIEHTIKFRVLY